MRSGGHAVCLSFSLFAFVLSQIGVATDRLQGDNASTTTLVTELDNIEKVLKGLSEIDGLKRAAEQALRIFSKRLAKNFGYDMLQCLQYVLSFCSKNSQFLSYRFLDPAVNQQEVYTEEERQRLVDLVTSYAKAAANRHKEKFNDMAFAGIT